MTLSEQLRRVAITGGNGCLGQRLAAELVRDTHVLLLDDYAGFHKGVVRQPDVEGDAKGLVEHVQCNLTEWDSDWVGKVRGADVVVHFAAVNPYPEATWEESRLSMRMSSNIVQAAQVGNVRRLVLATSNHVMGGYMHQGVDISTAPGVLSVCWFAAKAYGFCLVAVFLLQRKLMFLPSGTVADPAAQGGSPDVVILPSGSAAAFFKPAAEDGPVLVFFHGNADQVGWGPAFLGVEFGRRYGFGLYAVEYPGYGLAKPGSPTEANINAAAEELITHLIREEKIAKSRLVLVGQSIGCAVAVEMARRGFGEKLILLSPFTSSKAIAEAVYPFLKPALRLVPQLVRDPFDNLGKAGELKLPTLVIHGTEDEVVPFDMGKQLSKAIDRAQFVPIHGTGHNDILDRLQVFEGIASFVRR